MNGTTKIYIHMNGTPQCKSSTWFYSLRLLGVQPASPDSSDPSEQSLSPSHTNRVVMHRPDSTHLNSSVAHEMSSVDEIQECVERNKTLLILENHKTYKFINQEKQSQGILLSTSYHNKASVCFYIYSKRQWFL